MPLLAPFASLFCLSPLRIAIAGSVHLLLVEWAELRTTARHLFQKPSSLSSELWPYIKPTKYSTPCIMRFV